MTRLRNMHLPNRSSLCNQAWPQSECLEHPDAGISQGQAASVAAVRLAFGLDQYHPVPGAGQHQGGKPPG